MSKEMLGRDLRLADRELGLDLTALESGDLETVQEEYNLAQALSMRLRTMEGELAELGHSNYGSRLHELIGEVNNERTRELARNYTHECVIQDPRVKEVVDIRVDTVKGEPNRIDISITLEAIGISGLMNIVYPFYLEVA
jgi:phage baseplate assembly protein W